MLTLLVPIVTLLASGFAFLHFEIAIGTQDAAILAGVGGTIASVGATMLGFLLASLAVLASINHTHLVSMMKRTGHYQDLLATIVFASLLFLGCSLFGYAIAFGFTPSQKASAVILGLHAAALVSLLDVCRKMWFVLSSLQDADDR